MKPFEFLIPKRPLSHQAKDSAHKQDWKKFVHARAFRDWTGIPINNIALKFTLVYLCEQDPADINNIIKPVQDALIGLVYNDDALIIDVQAHLRMTDELIEVTGLSKILQDAIISGMECVYVKIDVSLPLNRLL